MDSATIALLKPDGKVLLYFEVFSLKNEAYKKQIDGEKDAGVGFYCVPGCFHFGAPMDVVENEGGAFGHVREEGVEIMKGGFKPVVAVDKGEVDGGDLRCEGGEDVVEGAGVEGYGWG